MGPSKRRDVRQKVGLAIQTGTATTGDGLTEMLDVPVDDDSGEQVHPAMRKCWSSLVRSRISP